MASRRTLLLDGRVCPAESPPGGGAARAASMTSRSRATGGAPTTPRRFARRRRRRWPRPRRPRVAWPSIVGAGSSSCGAGCRREAPPRGARRAVTAREQHAFPPGGLGFRMREVELVGEARLDILERAVRWDDDHALDVELDGYFAVGCRSHGGPPPDVERDGGPTAIVCSIVTRWLGVKAASSSGAARSTRGPTASAAERLPRARPLSGARSSRLTRSEAAPTGGRPRCNQVMRRKPRS